MERERADIQAILALVGTVEFLAQMGQAVIVGTVVRAECLGEIVAHISLTTLQQVRPQMDI